MENFERFVEDNLIDMIDEKNRCVELTDAQQNELTLSVIEDDGDLIDWLLADMSVVEFNAMQADMVRAFIGKMSHDDFFLKYAGEFNRAKRAISEHYEDKIWNRYCDVFNPEPIDYYDEYGLKRSDFA